MSKRSNLSDWVETSVKRLLHSECDECRRKLRNEADESLRPIRNQIEDIKFRMSRETDSGYDAQLRGVIESVKKMDGKWQELRSDLDSQKATGQTAEDERKAKIGEFSSLIHSVTTRVDGFEKKAAEIDKKVENKIGSDEVPGAFGNFVSKHWRMIAWTLGTVGILVYGIGRLVVANQNDKLTSMEKSFSKDQENLKRKIDDNKDILEKSIGEVKQGLKDASGERIAFEIKIGKALETQQTHVDDISKQFKAQIELLQLLLKDRQSTSQNKTP